MTAIKKEGKEVHYSGGKSYYLRLKSALLPFVADKSSFKEMERANDLLQKFIRFVEKKFDGIWYIGTDIINDEVYERFMFHRGGFMEISLKGKIRVYLIENNIEKLKKAIVNAVSKLSSKSSALHLIKSVETGERLISLKDSVVHRRG